MAKFNKYTKKDGKQYWMFQAYIGIDEKTGKEKRTTRRGFRSKKEAQLALSRLHLEIEQKGFNSGATKSYTYEDVYELWVEQYKNTVKESTLQKTTRYFKNHILPVFGELKIDKIEVTDCQKAINLWSKKLKNFKIINNYASLVFRYAISLCMCVDDPTRKVNMPVRKPSINEEDEKLENFYEKEELVDFLVAAEKDAQRTGSFKWFTFFRFLAYTGVRKGEALALTWKDIDLSKETVRITKTLTHGLNNKLIVQSPKTQSSIRTISLDKETIEILKKWRSNQRQIFLEMGHNINNKNQLVFPNTLNGWLAPAKAGQEMDKIIKRYNIQKRVSIHGFRHTHCSLLFEAGATIKEVQDRLGHSDVQTTMNIYAHVSKKSKDRTAKKFAEYLEN